ncbi:MAG: RDD family protein [candidate division WOR-3 bacterium]|nr:RDD family protein [candidate division WOR-3 bacterium]MDH5683553.1 RDD family protein [candidate division WOR-3 bacterium]
MYCRNCGKELAETAEICVHCGAKPRKGNKYCSTCGAQTGPQAEYCIKCGTRLVEEAVKTSGEYAGFWRRLVAVIIDGLLLSIAGRIVFGRFGVPFLFFTKIKPLLFTNLSLSYILLGWVYYALMESSSLQATLGKMALGIVVTDLDGKRISFARATGRHFAKIISGIILYIGFIMAAFTEKKQALHDLIADCLVVKKKQ